MITLKKNSGSQVGMKMKATLKRGQKKKKKKLHSTQLLFPRQLRSLSGPKSLLCT